MGTGSSPSDPILIETGRRGGARPDGHDERLRLLPPLPPTLVLEGAAQPLRLEIRASQASAGRRPSGVVIGPSG